MPSKKPSKDELINELMFRVDEALMDEKLKAMAMVVASPMDENGESSSYEVLVRENETMDDAGALSAMILMATYSLRNLRFDEGKIKEFMSEQLSSLFPGAGSPNKLLDSLLTPIPPSQDAIREATE